MRERGRLKKNGVIEFIQVENMCVLDFTRVHSVLDMQMYFYMSGKIIVNLQIQIIYISIYI